MRNKDDMTKLIQQQVLHSQQCMESQLDIPRVQRTFAVGDEVYLKLQPYMQMLVAHHLNPKLGCKYSDPS